MTDTNDTTNTTDKTRDEPDVNVTFDADGVEVEDFDPAEADESLDTEDYDEVDIDESGAGSDDGSDGSDGDDSDESDGSDASDSDDSDSDDSDSDSDSGDDAEDEPMDASEDATSEEVTSEEAMSSDGESKDDDSDDDSESSGGSRSGRRRRGRRGRGGRGRGGNGGDAKSDDAKSDDAKSDDAKSDDAGESDAAPGDVTSSGSEAEDTNSKAETPNSKAGTPTSKDGDAKSKDGNDEGAQSAQSAQSELEQQIAKGGTRTAARKQGGGGGGNSRRGGGGGGGRGRSNRNPGGVPEEVRRAILAGPPKTMLVSHKPERTQIVVMEERNAVEHYMTKADDVTYVGNVYMARVQNVLPGMEAAFLDIGKGRNGVLYAGEVNYDELDVEESPDPIRIEDALTPGQAVLVQVTKDPMGSKGPRLTMQISLAGRYMVLSPNSDVFGISRKLTDKERDRLRRIVKDVKPSHHGVIVRTAATEASDEAITADLERLLAKWEGIEERAKDAKVLSSVYEEPPLVVKVIRDNFGADFDRLVVDDQGLHDQVKSYLGEVAPELLEKVHMWTPPADGEQSLVAAYEVTEQLRKATERKVWLPSGGYLIIETTEAMKVIDVNTGKFTGKKGSNLEEVVFKTNIEAAKEIVRQLRLRDMGGIIIIDFIDMLLKANQDEVIRTLERELLRDRTKTRVSDVSRLGLVQMTRKNVSAGLVESFSHTCDHCHGRGFKVDLS
ncbi:MAG: Rne/Rng family ribonuclease [Nitriliruptoraceae bacterium]|jgi:Rne/Rng family ribonuclease